METNAPILELKVLHKLIQVLMETLGLLAFYMTSLSPRDLFLSKSSYFKVCLQCAWHCVECFTGIM